MKFAIVLAVSCSAAFFAEAVTAQLKKSPASYAQIVADTRAINNENELMSKMTARTVELDLVPFGRGLDAFYQRGKKADEIAFTCSKPYIGGRTSAMIARTEASGDGGRFYHLDSCTAQ
ncbi:MAG: hypothetical protein EOP12_02345 [Pseudomonas sp.]|nr:MAG: hypothetical protein EOP12_02345 [Pseudomonas sp.]